MELQAGLGSHDFMFYINYSLVYFTMIVINDNQPFDLI